MAETEQITTVAWESAPLKLFVNRYIRTRGRAVNDVNRHIVQAAICKYEGRFPASCKDLERFLDARLIEAE